MSLIAAHITHLMLIPVLQNRFVIQQPNPRMINCGENKAAVLGPLPPYVSTVSTYLHSHS
jgi:hypothetical protein